MSHGLGFPDMAEIIPEGKYGSAKVRHVTVSHHDSRMTALKGGAHYVPEGKYAQLLVNGRLVMSDTRYERISNLEVVRKAHGRILIGGLGLGMVAYQIFQKVGVTSVTVLEKNHDVIRLVAPHLMRRFDPHGWGTGLEIIHADVFDWKPTVRSDRWNIVYHDIWTDSCEDNLPEIARLHQKYKYYLDRTDPDCWMGSWEQDTLRSQKRRDRVFA